MKNKIIYKTIYPLLAGLALTMILHLFPVEDQFTSSRSQVIAYRDLILKNDIDLQAFEKFVREEFTPTFEQFVPGVTALIVKGERGTKLGGF